MRVLRSAKPEFNRSSILTSGLMIILVLILATRIMAESNNSISFNKKEIVFFKWGTGDNEVSGSRFLRLDGKDNLYFLDGNGNLLIVSPDGSTIRKRKLNSIRSVDGDGNIYSLYSGHDGRRGFLLTRPDGSQEVHEDFDFNHEENGVAYNSAGDKSITVSGQNNIPSALPPRLLQLPKTKHRPAQIDFMRLGPSTFLINTKKINDHLSKFGKHLEADQIKIKVETENGKGYPVWLVGVDDLGESYFLCAYCSTSLYEPWTKASMVVYSEAGKKLSEVPLELDYSDKRIYENEVAMDAKGNFFQICSSQDGFHIYKWSRN